MKTKTLSLYACALLLNGCYLLALYEAPKFIKHAPHELPSDIRDQALKKAKKLAVIEPTDPDTIIERNQQLIQSYEDALAKVKTQTELIQKQRNSFFKVSTGTERKKLEDLKIKASYLRSQLKAALLKDGLSEDATESFLRKIQKKYTVYRTY